MKEILRINNEKRRELRSYATTVSRIVNEQIIPIARSLSFNVPLKNTEKRARYIQDLNEMRLDYIAAAVGNAENDTLRRVLEKSANELWQEAQSGIKTLYINSNIYTAIDYIDVEGKDIYSYLAVVNMNRIDEACTITLAEEDKAKMKEIEDACAMLNNVFNGRGSLFSGYITIVQGMFVPVKVSNYNPIK